MDVFGWITLVFVFIALLVLVGDSLVLLVRDYKKAIADGKLTTEELATLEADANLVAKGILKVIGLFRTL
jgi:hypothetical protein